MIHSHSQIWTPETINDIHSKAQGEYRLSGFNPFHPIAHFDDLVFLASGLTRFPLEGYKEKCNTETILGTRFSLKPLVLDTPVYVASDTALPRAVRIGLAKGSSLSNTALSIQGRMLPEERSCARKLVYGVPAEARISKSTGAVKAGALQLNVSSRMSTERLEESIKTLRKAREDRPPIFVSVPAGRVKEDVRAAVKAGADGIILQALRATVALSPESILSYCRMPVVAAIVGAREALRENRVLGEIHLIAGTGVRNGADAAKALALGADAVVISEGALVALGYQQPSRKSVSTEHGFRNGEEERVEIESRPHEGQKWVGGIDPSIGGERVAKFINSMTMEIALIARSLGKGDVHSLEYEDLSALTLEAAMMTGIKLSGE